MKLELGLCATLILSACGGTSSSVPGKFGSVALDSASTGVPVSAPRAFFYEYTSTGTGVCDTYVDDGICRLWQCNEDAYTSLPSITVLDAGTLGVSGANRELAFDRDEKGSYRVSDFDGTPLWNGGETLTATIGGSSDVPATTLSITAPPPLVVTAPVIPDGGLGINATSDFGLSWQQLTTADSVYVALSTQTDAVTPDGSTVANFAPAVDCKFAGNSGVGIVRSSLLGLLPKPAGLKGYQLD
ncbi:MAG TPA: hypothetical protein VFQ35_19450, partial [Polyangiaceae bacterium]|nr:hypothetical protein [Polyangiaceae bacterium]